MILYIYCTRASAFVVGFRRMLPDSADEEIYCKDINELMSWIREFFGDDLWK